MMTQPPLERAVALMVEELRLVGKGVLLAVSGGADSMALLWSMASLKNRLGLNLEVASLDHGVRAESADEVNAVREVSMHLGLNFHTRCLELDDGPGFEDRARDVRYQVLEEIRASQKLSWIATAHTADDQAETVLMRLGRGAGLRGLAGILRKRGHIIRPLLDSTRREIEAYLESQKVPYFSDPMNDDESFLRVRVRKRFLPWMREEFGPAVTHRLARMAQWAEEDEALLVELAQLAFARAALPDGTLNALTVLSLVPPLRKRVLRLFIEQSGLTVDGELLLRCERALSRHGTATLGEGYLLTIREGALKIESAPPRQSQRSS